MLLPSFQLFIQIHLLNRFIPLIRVHFVDFEYLLARKKSVFFFILVKLLSLLTSTAIMSVVRMEIVRLPLLSVQVCLLSCIFTRISDHTRFSTWTLSCGISISLLQETQIYVKYLFDIVILWIRLLL